MSTVELIIKNFYGTVVGVVVCMYMCLGVCVREERERERERDMYMSCTPVLSLYRTVLKVK